MEVNQKQSGSDNRGFGLIEVMFVLGLTTLVLSGVFQAIQVTYQLQHAARTKENLVLLTKDLSTYLADASRCQAALNGTTLQSFDRDELLGPDLAHYQDLPQSADSIFHKAL